MPLSSLDSPEREFYPVPRHDRLVLYFQSARTDGNAKGGADIWRARRSRAEDDFAAPRAVEELNTELDEHPGWVSADDCELFLVRYIDDRTGGYTPRVMSARRPL